MIALSKSPLLAVKTLKHAPSVTFLMILSLWLDRIPSAIDAIQDLPSAKALKNCRGHVDRGLLTVVSADTPGLQVWTHCDISK